MQITRICGRKITAIFWYGQILSEVFSKKYVLKGPNSKKTSSFKDKALKAFSVRQNVVNLHRICNAELASGMKDTIEHLGIVDGVLKSTSGSHVRVRIVQTSACSTCVAKAHCNASESKEKIIDVFTAEQSLPRVGEQVMLEGSTSMGMKAVIWSFGVPFLILFIVLLVCEEFLSFSELNSGLLALASLIPYYFVLYLLRGQFAKKFSFTIKPINN